MISILKETLRVEVQQEGRVVIHIRKPSLKRNNPPKSIKMPQTYPCKQEQPPKHSKKNAKNKPKASISKNIYIKKNIKHLHFSRAQNPSTPKPASQLPSLPSFGRGTVPSAWAPQAPSARRRRTSAPEPPPLGALGVWDGVWR